MARKTPDINVKKVQLKRKHPMKRWSVVLLVKTVCINDLFRVNTADGDPGLVATHSDLYFRGHEVEHVYSMSATKKRWISMPMFVAIEYLVKNKIAKHVRRPPKAIEDLPA
jgi:hypothetical protein